MLSIEEYKAIFDATPDGVVVVAADGMIRAVNPKTEQMFGWSADELIVDARIAAAASLPDARTGGAGSDRRGVQLS